MLVTAREERREEREKKREKEKIKGKEKKKGDEEEDENKRAKEGGKVKRHYTGASALLSRSAAAGGGVGDLAYCVGKRRGREKSPFSPVSRGRRGAFPFPLSLLPGRGGYKKSNEPLGRISEEGGQRSTHVSMEKEREKGGGVRRVGGAEEQTDLPRYTYIRLAENDVYYAANDDQKIKDIPRVTKITLHRGGGRQGKVGN